jgi:hypothetical protein
MRFNIPVTQLSRVVFALLFTVFTFRLSVMQPVQAQESRQVMLRQFDMMTASSGWILLDQQLYRTSDGGQTWEEISPYIPPDGSIRDVEFIDADTGWALWTTMNSDGSVRFHLAHTVDHGRKWMTYPLSLFEPSDIASHVEEVQMGWLDAETGWITVKQESGSNFSLGYLFMTSDGGNNWNRSTLPVADKIYFSDPQSGWAIGGPTSDQVFHTQDAGINWKNSRPADLTESVQALAYPPYVSDGQGLLVMITQGVENNLKAYFLNNSNTWSPAGQVELDVQPGVIGLSILDAQNFVAAIPATRSIVRMMDGEFEVLENRDGLSASIVEMDMVSLDAGWAKSIDSACSTDALSDAISCTSTVSLLQTLDGGLTWASIQLPLIQSDKISIDSAGVYDPAHEFLDQAGLENTAIFIGQGFDKCEIPTLSQMQTWWNSSPYKTVNLYIGGSSRACANSALTSSYLFQLYQQGWKFIPTWVGPQAPCTGYLSRMSSDVTTAYQQGVTQANLAVERSAALGLTGPAKTGSVIYYDIEAYGTNQACRDAVNAFMNGWVVQIHARGNLAGVYGSTLCDTGLSDFRNIANVPDVVWPARWYHNLGSGFYNPNASVWDLGSCIPNTVWSNHQRIRQYEGDHNETWGGLTLNIDSNVLDGVVAVPYDYPFVSSIVRTDPNPTDAATVGFTVSFSKSVTGVNNSDFTLTKAGVTSASIINVSGSGTTYTVTVNTGSGNGAIRLDVVDDDSIRDAANNPLGGGGLGNGNYTSGERYNIVTGADTVGVFRPDNGVIFLKNTNTSGFADIALNYGLAGDYPVVGDWDGNGTDTIGVYRSGRSSCSQLQHRWLCRDQLCLWPGRRPADRRGLERGWCRHHWRLPPSTGTFFLRNSNSAGAAGYDLLLGNVGDVGIAGDWNGDGTDTTGVFRPSNGIICPEEHQHHRLCGCGR